MINFIVVTHGEFGAYMVEAAEGIVGRQAHGVRTIATSSRLSVPEIKQKIARALRDLSNPDGTILFVDMPGGTPSNLSFPLVKDAPRAEMISGVNLYMLVSAFSHRDRLTLERLVEKIVADGQKAIRDVRAMYMLAAAGER